MRRFYALFCLMVAAISMYGFTVDGLVYTEDSYYGGVQVVTLVDKSFNGELVIPEIVTYNGVTYPVTSIFLEAFKDCIGITSAHIGNNVSEIDQSAFYGCTALSSVSLPESVTSIHINAFAGCSKLESFTIPSSISFVGDGAFKNTAWYNNQPDGLLYKDNILLGYKGSKPQGHLEIENGTIMVAGNAFGRCGEISSVSIPNTVKHICYQAFWITGLKEVTIPQSVISIGDRAFADCYSLRSVFSHITEPFAIKGIASGSFERVFEYEGQTLYVPAGTKAKYEATDGWKDFRNIVEMENDPSGVASVFTEEDGHGVIYNFSGQRFTTPHRGLNIIGGKKIVVR